MAHYRKHIKLLRNFRSIHKWTGISLFFFFIVLSITGLLLGWKKNSKGIILPPTVKVERSKYDNPIPIEQIIERAQEAIFSFTGNPLDSIVDRIDVRPSKGIAKVKFEEHYYGVQVNLYTGEPVQIAYRYSDLIEQVHDGSIIDDLFGIKGGVFKLIYTSVVGLALGVFIVTGIWLWLGPKYIRRLKNRS